ncbi:hypothetical protein [Mycobacterium montefiorense]|uniref:Secreted protein n=1 Tax=Mycobacterium montefiorense TaxID=154654 RepID=A0AA37UXS6_9MYCO|nr:hypothetical protein [Mycobacterium montefiorense]GBG36814.1 hypothetical protein MmonteBS_11860 [Mycobacterium montefiorense]GKU37720.1 hypothetical protein NJB14191_50660 [Mycobacterium montefiorense]GKU42679.1 hypothetical protein NJB14192_46620 [Mycobacterium montefiorense]GKU46446.1 hypothetical protein NJB14194_30650 [Mycobacterium montefiorense]GKU50971.1 hypothetical protein NJB14195_22170 [Mycobacterium montefiorense]
MRSVLLWLLVLFGVAFPAPSQAAPCQPAEFFVTDNADPLFEPQADMTITQGGVAVTGSTPLDGVYWSDAQQRVIFERSREFHLCGADEPALHTAAEAVRRQFDQESVLSFDYLPQHAAEQNAILITVLGVDIERIGTALAADPAARNRLRGASVTATDHTLILVAVNGDRDVARRLVVESGGDWNAAGIAYGRSEFVE